MRDRARVNDDIAAFGSRQHGMFVTQIFAGGEIEPTGDPAGRLEALDQRSTDLATRAGDERRPHGPILVDGADRCARTTSVVALATRRARHPTPRARRPARRRWW